MYSVDYGVTHGKGDGGQGVEEEQQDGSFRILQLERQPGKIKLDHSGSLLFRVICFACISNAVQFGATAIPAAAKSNRTNDGMQIVLPLSHNGSYL